MLLSLGLGAMPGFFPPSAGRLGFVPTAGDAYEDPQFIRRDLALLAGQGYKLVELPFNGRLADRSVADLESVDAVFVAGGNTFYLLQQLRLTGGDVVLTRRVRDGMPYVGASAGAVLVGPTIAPAGCLDDRAEAPLLRGEDGLGLIDFVPVPHYQPPYQQKWDDELPRHPGVRYEKLRDDEGLVVRGGLLERVPS